MAGTLEEYASWSSRWTSVGLNHLVLWFYQKTPFALFLFGLFNLMVFVFTLYFLAKNVLLLLKISPESLYSDHSVRFNRWQLLNNGVFLVSIAFIASIKVDETWFWLCASTTYLWSNVLFLMGLVTVISQKNSSTITFLGLFAFVYVGGSSGPLALIALLILVLLPVYLLRKKSTFELNKPLLLQRSALGFVFCLAALLILYFAKGNRVREQFFDEISFGYSLVLNVKMVGILFLKRIVYVLPFILVLCLPMVAIANRHKGNTADSNWKRNLVYLTLTYFITVYLFQLSITYKTQDVGAYRALFFVTICTIAYVLALYYQIGKNLSFSRAFAFYSTVIPLGLSTLYFGYQFVHQQSIVSKYAKAYDERIQLVKAQDSTLQLLELKPLPNSGLLYSAELSADTTYFTNQHFKAGLNVKFNVIVQKED